MKKRKLADSVLYRYRYLIAVILIALLGIFLTTYRFWSEPAGLSSAEINSMTTSGWLSISDTIRHPATNANYLVNLPWHFLQSISIHFLGMTNLAGRLPAVLLTLVSMVLLVILLWNFSSPAMAMIGGLLVSCAAGSISLSRSGVPMVMTIFLIVLTIFAGYFLLRAQKRLPWAIVFTISVAMLCYMKGGLYVVAAMVVACLLNNDIRYELRDKSNSQLMITGGCIIGLLLLPLIIVSVMQIGGYVVLGDLLALGYFKASNIIDIFRNLVLGPSGLESGIVVPVTTVVGLAIAIFGYVYLLLTARGSVRFNVISALLIVTVLASLFNTEMIWLVYVPLTLCQTFCFKHLADLWYGMFPNNPYARIFALIPLTALIGSLCILGITIYTRTINYTDVAYDYNESLTALNSILKNNKEATAVVAPTDQAEFYSLTARQYDQAIVYAADNSLATHDYEDGKVNRVIIIGNKNTIDPPKDAKLCAVRTTWTKKHSVLARQYCRKD